MSEKLKLHITMDVTESQCLALQSMFKYWNQLSHQGKSRRVCFFVDGDGDFHPEITMNTSKEIQPLTDKIEQLSIIEDNNGNRTYDFDKIDWYLDNKE